MPGWMDRLKFDASGLIPAVIQDHQTGRILMTAYMNRESLEKTLQTGLTHFWSRSRKRLWQKGETSGHIQRVLEVAADCDHDALLIRVEQTGVACHTGRSTCFHYRLEGSDWVETDEPGDQGLESRILDRVFQLIRERRGQRRDDSYVHALMQSGLDRILKKIGEESSELIISAKDGREGEIVSEMVDLWFHAMVLLAYRDIPVERIYAEFQRRFGRSGTEEKRRRTGRTSTTPEEGKS